MLVRCETRGLRKVHVGCMKLTALVAGGVTEQRQYKRRPLIQHLHQPTRLLDPCLKEVLSHQQQKFTPTHRCSHNKLKVWLK